MSKRIFYIFMILWMVSANTTFAHPGNTDSSGGHTCRTNCEDWGLNYGEYHYHDSTPASSVSDYEDGYDRGYELAYSSTSQCEEEYERWWEGPQEFGDGYEQGIDDGHQEGLLVCYEDSHQAGYDQGYSDYIDDYEYNAETDELYDSTSYEKGYVDGWAQAESEVDSEEVEAVSNESSDDSSMDSSEDAESEEELPDIDQESLYDDGYDEGFIAAEEDYLYNDFNSDVIEKELEGYKKGYFAGYIEGGGGTFGENIYYYSFQKYLPATILIGTVIFSGLIWFILKRRRNKQADNSSDEVKKPSEGKISWIISGFIITSIVGFFLIGNIGGSEPVNSEVSDNPYSYTSIDQDCDYFDTQEDAQLFYEANGGPVEDPHDLDRDNDGMACDWNP